MDTTKIEVQDKEEVKTFTINNVEIRILNLSLNKFVDLNVTLKQNNDFVNSVYMRIEGEEYTAWGNDDDYLENLVLNKLGLNRKEI
jgi:hypothetical protein